MQLDTTASINQTNEILADMSRKILQMNGIKYVITVAGYSLLGGSGENVALGVIGLEDWSKRTTKALSIEGITGSLSQKFGSYKNAELNFFAPPSVPGIGQSNGLSLELVATNTDATPQDLDKALKQYLYAANSSPEMAYAFSTFTADTPHVYLNIDRTKLQSYDIPVSALYNTLQSNLGATYINNITLSGQVNKVILQADFNYRRSIESIKNLYVKSNNGSLIKIDSFADVSTEISPKSSTAMIYILPRQSRRRLQKALAADRQWIPWRNWLNRFCRKAFPSTGRLFLCRRLKRADWWEH